MQVLSGLRYLNSPHASGARAIIHYDLKPGNILFDAVGDAKITDFGLSKFVEEADKDIELTSQGTGTYWWTHIHKLPPPCTHFWPYFVSGRYLPPECFRISAHGGPRISSKVDVWSLGVIFYQMLYGARPFGEGQSQEQLLRNHTMLRADKPEFPDKPKVHALFQWIRSHTSLPALLFLGFSSSP